MFSYREIFGVGREIDWIRAHDEKQIESLLLSGTKGNDSWQKAIDPYKWDFVKK